MTTTPAPDLDALRALPFFACLSQEEMDRIAPELRIRQFAKRETVIHKGGGGDYLLFLLSGQLQVVDITEDGYAVGLRILGPGAFFGEIALITGRGRSASVIALRTSCLAMLPKATALHLFTHSPAVAQLIMQHLAEKIQRDSDFRTLLSLHDKSRRVYTLLTMLKRPLNSGLTVVDDLPTHQDMASMVNTTRETVSRALAVLYRAGIAKKDIRRLIIYAPEQLEKLAKGSLP